MSLFFVETNKDYIIFRGKMKPRMRLADLAMGMDLVRHRTGGMIDYELAYLAREE